MVRLFSFCGGVMAQIKLRLATAADTAAVDALLAASYAQLLVGAYHPQVLAASLPIISRARAELLASGSHWLAVQRDKVVGAGGWTRDCPAGDGVVPGLGHIRHVVADPSQTRQGIGTQVMRRILQHGQAAGIGQFYCLAMFSAVPFYAACGFKANYPRDVELPNGVLFPTMHMSLQLPK
ncbi:Ribosomal protein S18 acetylase RimI [Pseudorhodobacter antarcticus]|uniref:Ribosomal protein S18 acetylase RimI n=2 Tax=Pseudorhodobacter antarcticus TaxID=1077947 RepID=A0A1H8MGV7_9RHOB|nr:Ribosomal protein S18 acetylase RimI [Pseudorhodobacter antarcticus]